MLQLNIMLRQFEMVWFPLSRRTGRPSPAPCRTCGWWPERVGWPTT
jgi:hypothetical protein